MNARLAHISEARAGAERGWDLDELRPAHDAFVVFVRSLAPAEQGHFAIREWPIG
jgi:hypothetical protein